MIIFLVSASAMLSMLYFRSNYVMCFIHHNPYDKHCNVSYSVDCPMELPFICGLLLRKIYDATLSWRNWSLEDIYSSKSKKCLILYCEINYFTSTNCSPPDEMLQASLSSYSIVISIESVQTNYIPLFQQYCSL